MWILFLLYHSSFVLSYLPCPKVRYGHYLMLVSAMIKTTPNVITPPPKSMTDWFSHQDLCPSMDLRTCSCDSGLPASACHWRGMTTASPHKSDNSQSATDRTPHTLTIGMDRYTGRFSAETVRTPNNAPSSPVTSPINSRAASSRFFMESKRAVSNHSRTLFSSLFSSRVEMTFGMATPPQLQG